MSDGNLKVFKLKEEHSFNTGPYVPQGLRRISEVRIASILPWTMDRQCNDFLHA